METLIKYLNDIVELSDNEIDLFSRSIDKVNINKGDAFIHYDKTCNKIGFIEDGLLEMTYHNESTEKTIDFFFKNTFATDYKSFLSNTPSQTQITAIKDTKLLVLKKNSIEALYDSNIKFQKIGRILAERFYLDFLERLRFQSLSPKIQYEKLRTNYPKMIQLIPQYKIASYLGVTPEWLSKIKSR